MVDIGAVSSTAVNIATMIISVLVIGGLGILLFLFFDRERKFVKYNCLIFEKDASGKVNITRDKAGVFKDKNSTKKMFNLKISKVGLNPDEIKYFTVGKTKLVYLYKVGHKNYRFIDNLEVLDEGIYVTVGEEDISQAIDQFERAKKLGGQSLIMQLLPFIAIAFTSVIILVIFIYFFKNFDVLKDVAIALQNAAEAIRDASSGTIIK